MSEKTLGFTLPTPEEIHAELVATIAKEKALRKLLRLSQRLTPPKKPAGGADRREAPRPVT